MLTLPIFGDKVAVKMLIPKAQFKQFMDETQPPNMKIIDVFVRTKDPEDLDFDELTLEVEISPPVIRRD